jgi:hypothetical protein
MEQPRSPERPYNPEKEQTWRQIVAEWNRSGQSQVAFCRYRQISRARFVYWKRRLESEDISGGKVTLMHVGDLSDSTVRTGMTPRGMSEPMVLTVNGKYRIEVGERFDGVTLKRLLDVLEGW